MGCFLPADLSTPLSWYYRIYSNKRPASNKGQSWRQKNLISAHRHPTSPPQTQTQISANPLSGPFQAPTQKTLNKY